MDDGGLMWWAQAGQQEEYEFSGGAAALDSSETKEKIMALIATASAGADFKPTPAGVFIARCYRIIDLGTQRGEWKGKEKWSRKIVFSWELFGEEDDGTPLVAEDGFPLVVSKRYTLSLGENSNLRADLKSWRGRDFTLDELNGFDVKNVLGAYCMLNITHDEKDGKTYANVASISPLPSALRNAKPDGVNDLSFFDVTEPDRPLFATLSAKLQETIQACKEWNKEPVNAAATRSASHAPAFADMDDDIPF